jgi:predicted ATPase/transcriptional regulator with XRE-family HTH domain
MSIDLSETLGDLLRHYRMHAGLTQEALAERAGLSPNAISALERGERRRPYPHTLQVLANALKLQPEQYERLVHLREKGKAKSTAPDFDSGPSLRQRSPDSQSAHALQGKVPLVQGPLIGRENEYRAVLRYLANPQCRLLTLAGPGGVGKTRLAVQVANDLAPDYPHGVAWVSLVPITEADQVSFSILESLDIQVRGTQPVVDQILAALRDREILLVLDNMEHVLEAVGLIENILDFAPGVTCLVTSRERLGSKSEWVFDMLGLAIPEGKYEEEFPHTAAIQLFEARGRQAAHDFTVNHTNLAAITRICQLVDGLPLGIELAAAWVRTLSPAEIADEISHNLDFLTTKDRSGPSRPNSIQAALNHSWNLLSEEEQQVLARLAVFRGGCDLSAAKAVAGGRIPVLAALVDKSILHRAPDSTGLTRFELHELVRQYTLAKLRTDPAEEIRTRNRHCAYFTQQMSKRTNAFLGDDMHTAWLEVAIDLENIRGAWEWVVQQRDHQALAQMGPSLYLICEFQGFVEEGLTWFREAAHALRAPVTDKQNDPEMEWTLGKILSLYGKAAAQGGRYREALDQLTQGYELLRQHEDILAQTGTLVGLGYTTLVLGSYSESREWFTLSIRLSRVYEATFILATSESMLGMVAQAEGAQDALPLAQAGLEDWRSLGNSHGLASGLWALSCILLEQGLLAEAQEAAEEALQFSSKSQDPWAIGSATLQLGAIALAQGNANKAQDFVQESVDIFTQLGEPWSLCRALVTRGWVALEHHQHNEARDWFKQALNKAHALQLEPLACRAQYGLAYLIQEEAPAAALVFLEQVINNPAAERTIRDNAIALRQVLLATE